MKYTQSITKPNLSALNITTFKDVNLGVGKSTPFFVNTSLQPFNKVNIKYNCEDYIEVPGGTETIITTDEDGQSYEISVPDLISADEDNEIQITKSKRKAVPMIMATFTRQRVYC